MAGKVGSNHLVGFVCGRRDRDGCSGDDSELCRRLRWAQAAGVGMTVAAGELEYFVDGAGCEGGGKVWGSGKLSGAACTHRCTQIQINLCIYLHTY